MKGNFENNTLLELPSEKQDIDQVETNPLIIFQSRQSKIFCHLIFYNMIKTEIERKKYRKSRAKEFYSFYKETSKTIEQLAEQTSKEPEEKSLLDPIKNEENEPNNENVVEEILITKKRKKGQNNIRNGLSENKPKKKVKFSNEVVQKIIYEQEEIVSQKKEMPSSLKNMPLKGIIKLN